MNIKEFILYYLPKMKDEDIIKFIDSFNDDDFNTPKSIEEYTKEKTDYTKVKVKTKFPSYTREAEELIIQTIKEIREEMEKKNSYFGITKLTDEQEKRLRESFNKIKVDIKG